MTHEQILIFAILAGTLALFIWERWRYDVVAAGALTVSVLVGLVPAEEAFKGFSDPVVTTVACVLIISQAVRNSGVLELLVQKLQPLMQGENRQVAVFAGLCTAFSAFMNNVGALALFLPIVVYGARKIGRSPSELLMPLSFGSLLGGLITLIGTPPNILIAAVRRDYVGEPFGMFDFTPVGLGIAVVGVAFLSFGWRLLPGGRRAQTSPEERFRIEDYIAEARVPAGSAYIGRTTGDLEALGEGDLSVVGILREERRRLIPSGRTTLQEGDVLTVEAEPTVLRRVIDSAELELVGAGGLGPEALRSEEVAVMEAVVLADSQMVRCSPVELRLRSRFGVNLLAVRRRGRPIRQRLAELRFQEGDVILLQGHVERMSETLETLGCLPLAERNLLLGRRHRAFLPPALLAVAVIVTSLGVLPVAISFLTAVLLIAVLRLLTLREIYDAIDWPVIVLLGAFIPVTEAVQRTGGTELIAGLIAGVAQGLPGFAIVGLILIATMLVTPILNNAATVLLMAPIAATLAKALGLNLDPMLMAVAIGASCDFLTPIGHQSNTLVMGPGGYRFGDYWRLGLPLSTLVVVLGVPLILLFWPLH